MNETTCINCDQIFQYQVNEYTFDGELIVPHNCPTCIDDARYRKAYREGYTWVVEKNNGLQTFFKQREDAEDYLEWSGGKIREIEYCIELW